MDAEPDDSPPTTACRARCPMCGSASEPVEVHGHVQCASCGVNIDPCCGGAPLDEAA